MEVVENALTISTQQTLTDFNHNKFNGISGDIWYTAESTFDVFGSHTFARHLLLLFAIQQCSVLAIRTVIKLK